MPMPPRPGGVEMAAMVSLVSMAKGTGVGVCTRCGLIVSHSRYNEGT